MASPKEAQAILKSLGMPPAQHNRMSGLTLIALCGMTPESSWSEAERKRCTVTKGIMDYLKDNYGTEYAPNTRETFRRHVLHQFIQGRIADLNPFEPGLSTNSPNAHYAVTEAALRVVQSYGTKNWNTEVENFLHIQGSLLKNYQQQRDYIMVPIRLPENQELRLSPGPHNELQKSIVEEFGPRFAPGAQLLYLGDTAKKDLLVAREILTSIGISITSHDKVPDVVLFDDARNWLFLIEAVTSHGPMSPMRVAELKRMLGECSASVVYVSAFPDISEFRRHLLDIAWETEVWISDSPDHMIHYDGDRFLGPTSEFE